MSFDDAVHEYRVALSQHLELLRTGKLDNEFYKSGRRCRKCLKRAFSLAARHRIIWTPGDCRTFY